MIIRRLSASFGNLKNDTLSLESGLNVIEAPNETGKSTWCAFIRAMLYGINTSDRDKAGYLPDKTRYRPWNGGTMEGTMEVETGGRRITLQRTAQGQAPMKKFSALYTGTGETADFLTGETAGEILTGMPERVFERTAFIRQAGMRIGGDTELEKRISSIVSTGEETTSYTETNETLELWKRRLQSSKNTGTIPRLRAELAANEEKFTKIEKAQEMLSEMRRSILRLESQKKQSEEELKAHDVLDRLVEKRRITEAAARAKQAENDAAFIRRQLTVNGRLTTREDIARLREDAASLSSLRSVILRAEETKKNAEAESRAAELPLKASPFSGHGEEAVDKLLETLGSAQTAVSEKAGNRPIPKRYLLIASAALFCGAALSLVLRYFAAASVCAAAALVCGILFLRSPGTKDSARNILEQLLLNYGFSSAEEFRAAAEAYIAVRRNAEEKSLALLAAQNSAASAHKAAEETTERFLAKVRELFPNIKSLSDVSRALSEFEELCTRLTKAEFTVLSEQNVCEALSQSFSGDPASEDAPVLSPPLRSREDNADYLRRTVRQIEEETARFNVASGEARALGDPAAVAAAINFCREEIATQENKYTALQIAAGALSGVYSDMQKRFSPILGTEAGKIMRGLTGGKYEKLLFDRTFGAEVREAGAPVAHSALSLSAGTADQLYFSLRLAMCRLLSGKSEPCPIILDDALVSFDDARLSSALALLKDLSVERQIIIFTCQDREASYVSEDVSVNIVRLG
ncbi:MAG: hypothetical protein EOM54_13170 [Clostridia bacterium]|nr:hypothetical protein [Clostridia bacterium]